MKLEDIGFYTLSDYRAAHATHLTPLWRCELLVTQQCNFNCPYCRKLKGNELDYDMACDILNLWALDSVKNIRFSGGEPTLWGPLIPTVKHAKLLGIERIALSTNGSAESGYYDKLIEAGVDDFSISLDACCASLGDIMAGKKGQFGRVTKAIRYLSSTRKQYVTVGVVLTEKNIQTVKEIIDFAHSLGVSDIRVIPAAQYGKQIPDVGVKHKMAYPILKYRIENMENGKSVRGLKLTDNHKCPLVLDDMAIWGGHHYPCIIYLRERGLPIGSVGPNMRQQRSNWYKQHDCYKDSICKNNCLDVCVCYNNKHKSYNQHTPHNS